MMVFATAIAFNYPKI